MWITYEDMAAIYNRILDGTATEDEELRLKIAFETSCMRSDALLGIIIRYAEKQRNDTIKKTKPRRMTMIPKTVYCEFCGEEVKVNTYRKFVICPDCGERFDFEGFDYRCVDWGSSMYSSVKKWMNCPVCRSPNMYLGPSKRAWKCPDCGFTLPDKYRRRGVFWFCDHCETFMNVQKGFNTKTGRWKCTVCGHDNDVSEDNII